MRKSDEGRAQAGNGRSDIPPAAAHAPSAQIAAQTFPSLPFIPPATAPVVFSYWWLTRNRFSAGMKPGLYFQQRELKQARRYGERGQRGNGRCDKQDRRFGVLQERLYPGLFWARSKCHLGMKERKLWMMVNAIDERESYQPQSPSLSSPSPTSNFRPSSASKPSPFHQTTSTSQPACWPGTQPTQYQPKQPTLFTLLPRSYNQNVRV